MSDMKSALAAMEELIAEKEQEVAGLKKAANTMAAAIGEQPLFADVEAEGKSGRMKLRADAFVDERAPASAARAYLGIRGKARGATTLEDILDALQRGGYDFGDQKGEAAKAGLKIALAKDNNVFKLTNGTYGLREWYKAAVDRTGDKSDKADESDGNEPQANTTAPVTGKKGKSKTDGAKSESGSQS